MNSDELRKACETTIASGCDVILLTLPPPPGNGYTMRLLRTSGPRGDIVCTNQQTGASVVRFRASRVLKYLDKATMQAEEQTK